ncbi:uncharacterized protein LOC116198840 isoform X2 [Punica granatum]|uniref:Uncharacterized protein LOC116198840 isoform X2 n=1 Tax=Punica granatum TaxID=22663 RepID=A0A218WNB9_PUNGR|nr:uncharacterized protein LOC116198840 isoform X2 [Punica granatum]OWM73482.1 hypothetical protein CDL15_Pgr026581 [Punica granatum]
MDPAEPDSDADLGFGSAPPFAFLAPTPSPASRRLSSSFSGSNRPLPPARKRLAYVDLQGRLVGAEEATSAWAIGGLGREEVAAWQLFSPIQRVVLVAVIGVAVAESRKNRLISQLKKSVEVRDQILSSMEQKLDSLCEQVHGVNKQPGSGAEVSPSKSAEFPFDANFDSEGIKFVECGCWLCDHHQKLFNGLEDNATVRTSIGYDMLQGKPNLIGEAEQEERRMSDLSDLASSVTSAADIQMNVAIEQVISNLKREGEEKDATIRELTKFLHSSDAAGSKRINELEEIIRRKNMITAKLKKDMAVLEQKVVQLTRLRRPSTQKEEYDDSNRFPFLAENILYDMDSTTSPSSSDSDGSPGSRSQPSTTKLPETPSVKVHAFRRKEDAESENVSSFSVKRVDEPTDARPGSPLREISTNQKPGKNASMRARQLHLGSGDMKKRSRAKQTHGGSKAVTPRQRWS